MKNKNNLLSICLPTYNREWCLSDAIRSVLGQTYENWELIIVDDGSTDSTKDLMSFWCSKDRRIRYIRREENKGISYSRNEGVENSTGKVIVLTDSDDLMLADRLELVNHTYNENKFDVMYTDFYSGDPSGNPTRLVESKEFSDELLDGRQEIANITIAVDTDFAKRVPWQNDKRINDDWFWLVDVYNAGAKFVYVKHATMIERGFSSGVSRQSRKQYDKDFKDYKINKELRKQNVKNI